MSTVAPEPYYPDITIHEMNRKTYEEIFAQDDGTVLQGHYENDEILGFWADASLNGI